MPHVFPTIHDCVPIGKIARTHGNEGFVLVNLHADYVSLCKELEYIFLEIQHKLVPFFIQSCKSKGGTTYIQFDDITTIQLAESLCGYTMYIHTNEITKEEDEGETHELIGYKLYNSSTYIGTITDVFEYSMNVVLSVETDEEQEVLVPLANDLITEIQEDTKRIYMQLPDGVFDL